MPHGRVMVHQPYWRRVQGQISDIEIQANEILRYRTLLNEILGAALRKTGRTNR
ncbi:MAG: ATP-dependent Clp protease proteolytic subunit [Pirellulaceae bacterium]